MMQPSRNNHIAPVLNAARSPHPSTGARVGLASALAPRAQTGGVASTGFGLLGGLWLAFTVLAFLRIRRGDQAAHRRWMLRSFALTLAAVALRIYLPLSAAVGWSFDAAYPVIAWLCWVPNLLLSELYLLRGPRAVSTAAI